MKGRQYARKLSVSQTSGVNDSGGKGVPPANLLKKANFGSGATRGNARDSFQQQLGSRGVAYRHSGNSSSFQKERNYVRSSRRASRWAFRGAYHG